MRGNESLRIDSDKNKSNNNVKWIAASVRHPTSHGSWWWIVDIQFVVMIVKNDEEWVYEEWVWCWWMYEDGDEDGEEEEGRRWRKLKKINKSNYKLLFN